MRRRAKRDRKEYYEEMAEEAEKPAEKVKIKGTTSRKNLNIRGKTET